MAGLIAKRSDADLAKLIQAPDATMKAGGMPPLVASATEVSSVVAYLRSIGQRQEYSKRKVCRRRTPLRRACAEWKGGRDPRHVESTAGESRRGREVPRRPTGSDVVQPGKLPAANAEASGALPDAPSLYPTGARPVMEQMLKVPRFAASLIDITEEVSRPLNLRPSYITPKQTMRARGHACCYCE